MYSPIKDAANGGDVTLSKLTLHDFLVDLLGGLFPGVLFVAASVAMIVPSSLVLVSALGEEPSATPLRGVFSDLLLATEGTPNMIWIGTFILFLLLCYVVGHLFYRSDPKNPDRASFVRLTAQRSMAGWVGSLFLKKSSLGRLLGMHSGSDRSGQPAPSPEEDPDGHAQWLRDNLACTTSAECEFPYPFLADYLKTRGHHHLVRLVTWEDEVLWRSKTFVNRLKIWLEYHRPAKYRRIVRNEAHVRLASSMWYVALALGGIALISAVVTTTGLGVALQRGWFASSSSAVSWYVVPILPILIVATWAQGTRVIIERFMHYQRLREVFYVLEIAHAAAEESQAFGRFYNDLISAKRPAT